jgi:GntR family transcriptional regulator, rspAB operon transcriptional repressor
MVKFNIIILIDNKEGGVFIINVIKPDIRNLHEQTYWYLHQLIISHQLKPGSRINYDQLSEELGISKTPLRDAFNRLSQEGLVEIKPRSGTFVSVPNIKDVREVYDVRKALERQSIELAIDKIPQSELEKLLELNHDVEKKFHEKGDFQAFLDSDRVVHKTIIKYSNNSRIIHIMDTLNAQMSWFGYLIIGKIRDRVSEATEHHQAILEAMMNKDLETAMKMMEYHIDKTKHIVIKDISK